MAFLVKFCSGFHQILWFQQTLKTLAWLKWRKLVRLMYRQALGGIACFGLATAIGLIQSGEPVRQALRRSAAWRTMARRC
jgi:hypothetical protein